MQAFYQYLTCVLTVVFSKTSRYKYAREHNGEWSLTSTTDTVTVVVTDLYGDGKYRKLKTVF